VHVAKYVSHRFTNNVTICFFKKKAECEAEADLDEGDDSAEGIRIKAHHITKIAAELLLDL
jgi:hypothetical protein